MKAGSGANPIRPSLSLPAKKRLLVADLIVGSVAGLVDLVVELTARGRVRRVARLVETGIRRLLALVAVGEVLRLVSESA
jgi:hypothetical protein